MFFDDCDDMLPRNVPQPAPFIETTAKPTVPEVSLLFDQEKSNRLYNPNRSILKGNSTSNRQQSKIDTNVNTIPKEPYNTWRWKHFSQQNSNRYPDTKISMQTRPLRFDDQKRDDSDFRNVFQQPLSPLQQQNFDMPSQVNVRNSYNYQNNEPLQNSTQRAHGIQNVSDQLNTEQLYNHGNFPKPQQCLVSQRIHPDRREMSHFNEKSSQITEEPNRFEVFRPTYNTVQQNYAANESQIGNEHQFSRNMYKPTVLNEDNNFYCDKRFNFDGSHSSNQELRTSNPPNSLRFSSHHLCNTPHDHSCDTMSNHRIPNTQRCSPKAIPCNAIHNSNNVKCTCVNCIQADNQNFIKDMFNIIQTQSMQISKLQDQIKQLIQLHSNCHRTKDKVDVSGQFDSPNMHLGKGRRTKCTVTENLPIIEEHSDSNSAGFQNKHSSKVSVGVMTSDINPFQQDLNKVNISKNCYNCDCKRTSTPPKVVETSPRNSIPQNVSNGSRPSSLRKSRPADLTNPNEEQAVVDKSFTLNEADLAIGTIAEQIPSPTSSVHVDMQEYNSSSYEDSNNSESSSEERDSTEPQVGWTFYNNVLGQVNNILNKNASPSKPPPDSFDAVRNATLEQFRRLGISFTDVDNTISKKVTFDAKNTPQYDTDDKNETDVTMHFNALAMQCVNDELGTMYPDKMQDVMVYNVASGNTNLSFATLRYLERYHLLPKNQDPMFQQQATTSKESHVHKMKKLKKKKKEADPTWYQPRKPTTKNSVASKILDITTLKQQPKLL